ncbi:hypothetical protein KUV57_11400 [Epibacterium sp. DP7N7-1]|nr:hypothetical protein [Epibacterium sp. DP7N7-1]
MKVRLFFKDIDGEAVPYLWNNERGENPQEGASSRVSSLIDFDMIKGEYRNRARQIKIVEGRAVANALALIDQSESRARSIITQLDNHTWAVGSVLCDGSYDSGIPAITDTRQFGMPVFIDADQELVEALEFEVLIARNEPSAEIIAPAPEYDNSLF